MNENKPQEPSGESLQDEARASIQEGAAIRDRVHDLTLRALSSRRLDRHSIRQVVDAVTTGIAAGADSRRGEFREALADAFRGLDDALTRSAEAGRQAVSQLVATGKDLSDNEIRQALDDMRHLEEDFLSAASRAAEGAGARVRPELRALVHTARATGTATGKAVAVTMTEFAQRFSVSSIEIALAGLEVAGEVGSRFAQLASGILAGIADALSKRPAETKRP